MNYYNGFRLFLDRSEDKIKLIEEYLKATRQLRNYSDASQDPHYTKVQKNKGGGLHF